MIRDARKVENFSTNTTSPLKRMSKYADKINEIKKTDLNFISAMRKEIGVLDMIINIKDRNKFRAFAYLLILHPLLTL